MQKYGKEYAYIFNTVPKKVLTSKELENVSGEVTIIDIASRPGGTDFEYCRANKINEVQALGLPGKYAPKRSAEVLMKVIEQHIN